jgi:DNA (cytosine-5)-methyltransferase 1
MTSIETTSRGTLGFNTFISMKFGSVCSGIEAASVAWESLGFEAQWFSEIEHFPSEVLKHRYPAVPNLGDMTKLMTNETFRESTIDILVGGTPCQSFSVAGLRGGLADPRGNLMLTFLGLADAKKPRWIVWENVPGVLSSNGGKDFGTFLGALGELGYGFAYRVLDAQYFGVAQRRRRVFVVGYLGDWRPAAAVLFERESLSGHPKQSRKKGQEVASDAQGGVGATGYVPRLSNALCARDYKGARPEADQGAPVVAQPSHAFKVRQGCEGGGKGYLGQDEKAFTIAATQDQQIAQPISWDSEVNCNVNKMGTLVRGGQGGRTDGVAQPQYFENHPQDSRVTGPHNVANTVSANYGMGGGNTPLVAAQPTVIDRAAFNQGQNAQYEPRIEQDETMSSLVAKGPHAVQHSMAIRRLTPLECEKLQGFSPNWTKIPYRNKPADQCPDGPRYKACGNSMAVPVMRWIGKRIQLIDTIIN